FPSEHSAVRHVRRVAAPHGTPYKPTKSREYFRAVDRFAQFARRRFCRARAHVSGRAPADDSGRKSPIPRQIEPGKLPHVPSSDWRAARRSAEGGRGRKPPPPPSKRREGGIHGASRPELAVLLPSVQIPADVRSRERGARARPSR